MVITLNSIPRVIIALFRQVLERLLKLLSIPHQASIYAYPVVTHSHKF